MSTAYGISNCIGWYRASAGVFNDAGTTTAANGDAVHQWNDQSGAGNHLTQTATDNRPLFNLLATPLTSAGAPAIGNYGYNTQEYQQSGPASLIFDGSTSFLNMPGPLSLTSAGCTVLMCTRGQAYSPVSFGTDDTNSINYGWVMPQQMAIRNHGLHPFGISTFLPAMSPIVHGFRCSASLNQTRLYMGTNQTADLAANWCNFSMTGGAVGQTLNVTDPDYGAFNFLGEIYELLIFSTPLSDSQVQTLLSNLQSANQLPVNANSSQVIFIGDSATAGGPDLEPFFQAYPWVLCQQYGGMLKPLVIAGTGQALADQQTAITTSISTLNLDSFAANVAVVCCGSDEVLLGETAPQIVADLATLCSGLKRAGFKVIVATITPRDATTSYSTASINTLNSVNALIRSGYGAYANALADWAADPRLADCTNAIYFADGRNTTAAGDGVKATIVKTVLDPILNQSLASTTLSFGKFYAPGQRFAGQFANFAHS